MGFPGRRTKLPLCAVIFAGDCSVIIKARYQLKALFFFFFLAVGMLMDRHCLHGALPK